MNVDPLWRGGPLEEQKGNYNSMKKFKLSKPLPLVGPELNRISEHLSSFDGSQMSPHLRNLKPHYLSRP